MAFKPIPSQEHPGWYEVPGYQSCCANRKGEILIKKTGHITKGGKAGRYLRVSVYPDGSDTPKLEYVHEMICRAFHEKPKEAEVVLHKDDQRFNNASNNLEWGTQSKNIQDVYKNGLRKTVSKEGYVWLNW